MKTSKEQIRQEQELRKELVRVGYRDQLNQLATKLQISEGIKPVQAIQTATLETAAVAVRDGELSASLLPGAATPKAGRPVKRTPVKASTPAKPKADLYVLPGGNIGMKHKAIRQAGILAAQTLKAARKTATEVFSKKADELWAEYSALGTYARVAFHNQHKLQMKRN